MADSDNKSILGDALGGIGSVVGGIFGNIFGAGDQQRAYDAMQRAVDVINAVGAPPDLAKQIIYNQFQNAGLYTPALQKAVEQNFSNLANVQDSPERAAQVQALNQLQDLSHTGLNAQDRLAYNQLRNQLNQNASSRQAAIMQDMQARGAGAGGASGAQLAAQLANAQQADNQLSQQGLDIAGSAAQRALQALTQAGQTAGQVRSQDNTLAQTRAQAQDEMNRFNVQTRNQINQQSTAAQNQAQAYNLQNQQNIMNANTQQANNELLRQRQAQQQNWLNQLGYAQAQAGAYGQQANLYSGKAQQTRSTFGGIGAGLGQGIGGVYQYLNSRPAAPNAAPSAAPQNNFGPNGENDYSTLKPDTY